MPKLSRRWSKLQSLATAIEAAAMRDPYPSLAQLMHRLALTERNDWQALIAVSKAGDCQRRLTCP